MTLRDELAPEIAPVLLANLTTHYPYHDAHFMQAGETPHDPIAVHPAFGNSFDWHSSVHSHWSAVAVIDTLGIERQAETQALLDALLDNLRDEHLAAEERYLREHAFYERPYGWAWLFALAAIVSRSRNKEIRGRAPALRAAASAVAELAVEWLAILPLPARTGTHANTAFALSLMHDAAAVLGYGELRVRIEQRAREWFARDRDWPVRFERSGSDFLSPALTEANLMLRVLEPAEFASWIDGFLPEFETQTSLLAPMEVPSVSDGHIVHLHGLNLSRASALARIASALRRPVLLEAARALYASSVGRASGGHYTETHWLPTFAWDAAANIDAADARLTAR